MITVKTSYPAKRRAGMTVKGIERMFDRPEVAEMYHNLMDDGFSEQKATEVVISQFGWRARRRPK